MAYHMLGVALWGSLGVLAGYNWTMPSDRRRTTKLHQSERYLLHYKVNEILKKDSGNTFYHRDIDRIYQDYLSACKAVQDKKDDDE